MKAETVKEVILILRAKYDVGVREICKFAVQSNVEKFQWYRGYLFGISETIKMLEDMEGRE